MVEYLDLFVPVCRVIVGSRTEFFYLTSTKTFPNSSLTFWLQAILYDAFLSISCSYSISRCNSLSLASVNCANLAAYVILFPIILLIWLFLNCSTSAFCFFYYSTTSSFFLAFNSIENCLFLSIAYSFARDCDLSLFLSLILEVSNSS